MTQQAGCVVSSGMFAPLSLSIEPSACIALREIQSAADSAHVDSTQPQTKMAPSESTKAGVHVMQCVRCVEQVVYIGSKERLNPKQHII